MPKTAKKRYTCEPEEIGEYSATWWVDDTHNPGFGVGFYGEDREALAREYAEWKNSTVK